MKRTAFIFQRFTAMPVSYTHLSHPSGSVEHLGDNQTGEGDGDDEQIQIDLSKVPSNISRIAFTATIYAVSYTHLVEEGDRK